MAESLLLPMVRGVVGKAGDALVHHVTRMWGIDRDRDKLEDRLVYVSDLLADAEVKAETDIAVERWMKKLKAATYKADDVLDDFQHEALRLEAQVPRSTTSKVLSYFTSQNQLMFRHKASRNLKDVLDTIDELMADMKKFKLVQRTERVMPQVLYRQTHSALDESADIFGRDDDMEVVVNLLLDQQDQQKVQVLPIIGMGGLGKTTLAKIVYNDHRVQKHFELKMWHCVSENFEAAYVVKSIIELATDKTCDLPDSKIELLKRRLDKVIDRKRFLVILDDVWNEEEHNWDLLRSLLCSNIGGSGSMIVVTSRSQKVATIMGTLPTYELKILSEDDSWKLFSNKAFVDKKMQERTDEFDSVGRSIVSKCMGMPLALKTMGGLMSSIQDVEGWKAIDVLNKGFKQVISILKLSYMHLSPEMKRCFAFCAVFPQDYEMEKDMLIQLWMANGYIIHDQETTDLEQKAECIFNELVWRSFLQPVIVVRRLNGEYYRHASKQEIHGCKMHDLMHDLASDVASECATSEDLIKKKVSIQDVHHLHISGNHQLKKISPLFKRSVNLRTLLMTPSPCEDLMDSKLMSSRALRCLCKDPSISSRQLIWNTHLRYLDLSDSAIVRLPDSICMLYNMQTLRLNSCCQLQYLPKDMRNMRKLSHLYLFRCGELKRMPPELGLLHNLCTLTTFVVDTEDGCGIEELKDLKQLGNRLELCNLRKAKNGSKANLQEKQKLTELLLYWGRKHFYRPKIDEARNAEELLESLVPHRKLQVLEVHGYGGLEFSKWMRDPQMFQCLRELIIYDCPRCEDLPVVWMSSCLEHLSLSSMDNITTLCKNINVEDRRQGTSLQILPKLKRLELCFLPQLVRWTENSESVTFPQLEKLTIKGCNKLANLPDCPVLSRLTREISQETSGEGPVSMSLPLGSWPSLVKLNVGGPVNLVVMPKEELHGQRPLKNLLRLKASDDNGFLALFDLKLRDSFAFVVELTFSQCRNIVRWPVDEFRCLPSLRSLSVCFCWNLVEDTSSAEIFPLPQLRRLMIRCCTRLKALPHGMVGLISLEGLHIIECPEIENFPHGLFQRLATLKKLSIWKCPKLERRCRKGGEYFDLISSIPNCDIW